MTSQKANVSSTSDIYHSSDEYNAAVNKLLGSVRDRNKLTFDVRGLETALIKQFPELSDVKVSFGIIAHTPKVKLTISAPSFNFSSGGRTYVISANGVVVGGNSLPASAKLPLLSDQSGFFAEPGKQVLGTSEITFINTVIAQTKRAKVTIDSLILPSAPQELDLKAKAANYIVKFDLNGDANLQTGQYLAAKHKFETDNIGPNQYLDVRIPGKIYYK